MGERKGHAMKRPPEIMPRSPFELVRKSRKCPACDEAKAAGTLVCSPCKKTGDRNVLVRGALRRELALRRQAELTPTVN